MRSILFWYSVLVSGIDSLVAEAEGVLAPRLIWRGAFISLPKSSSHTKGTPSLFLDEEADAIVQAVVALPRPDFLQGYVTPPLFAQR